MGSNPEFKHRDRVVTSTGFHGYILEPSTIGEYKILLDNKQIVWLFPDDFSREEGENHDRDAKTISQR